MDRPHVLVVLANGGEIAADLEHYHEIQKKLLNGNEFIVGVSCHGGNFVARAADISAVIEMSNTVEETPEWLRQ